MDGRTDGRMDRQTDRQTDTSKMQALWASRSEWCCILCFVKSVVGSLELASQGNYFCGVTMYQPRRCIHLVVRKKFKKVKHRALALFLFAVEV